MVAATIEAVTTTVGHTEAVGMQNWLIIGFLFLLLAGFVIFNEVKRKRIVMLNQEINRLRTEKNGYKYGMRVLKK